jgi:ubiquinone/menaquinone biosynthesis C-methylase UbiE
MQSKRDAIRDHYDAIGSRWRRNAWADDEQYARSLKAFAALPRVSSMLDVGTGAGDFASLFSADRVVGIDMSRSMLDACATVHPEFELHHGDAEKLPFAGGSFDLVICRNYLQNFDDPRHAFASMVDVARPGGTILVAESAVNQGEQEWPTRFCRVVEPFHPTFPTHEGLRQLFDTHRLVDVRQTVLSRRGAWLKKWMDSRGATHEQHAEGYRVLTTFPAGYREKYEFLFHPEHLDLDSRLTFAAIVGVKRGPPRWGVEKVRELQRSST